MNADLLKPVVAMVIWTLVVLAWGLMLRIASIKQVDVNIAKRMTEAGALLPTNSQYKIDNYNHLVEQPTLFYAVALALAVFGAASAVNLALCWAYVGLRVIHSIVHATSNPVMVRFVVFLLGTAVLICLTASAALTIF